MLQPFWNPGIKSPGPEAKGAIIGFGDVHTRAHVYRSILEGLAYALREGAERTSRRSHVPIREVREDLRSRAQEDSDSFVYIKGLEDILAGSAEAWALPGEAGYRLD